MAASRPRRASRGREPQPSRMTAADLLAARRVLGHQPSADELEDLKAGGELDAPLRTKRHRTAPARAFRGGPHLQGVLPLSDSPPVVVDVAPGTPSGTVPLVGVGTPPIVPPSSNALRTWAKFLRETFGMLLANSVCARYGVPALRKAVAEYAEVANEEEVDHPAGFLIYLLRQGSARDRGEASHG